MCSHSHLTWPKQKPAFVTLFYFVKQGRPLTRLLITYLVVCLACQSLAYCHCTQLQFKTDTGTCMDTSSQTLRCTEISVCANAMATSYTCCLYIFSNPVLHWWLTSYKAFIFSSKAWRWRSSGSFSKKTIGLAWGRKWSRSIYKHAPQQVYIIVSHYCMWWNINGMLFEPLW